MVFLQTFSVAAFSTMLFVLRGCPPTPAPTQSPPLTTTPPPWPTPTTPMPTPSTRLSVQLLNPLNLSFTITTGGGEGVASRWVTDSWRPQGYGWADESTYDMSEVALGHGVIEYPGCPPEIEPSSEHMNWMHIDFNIDYTQKCEQPASQTSGGAWKRWSMRVKCFYNTWNGLFNRSFPEVYLENNGGAIKKHEVTATSVTLKIDDYFEKRRWWEQWRNHETECARYDMDGVLVPDWNWCECQPSWPKQIPNASAPLLTIMQLARETEELAQLAWNLEQHNLTGILNGEGPFTLFAPTNAAFNAAACVTRRLSPEEITDFLTYHVVGSKILTVSEGQSLATRFESHNLNVSISSSGGKISTESGLVANIIATYDGSNGVVHVVDAVFLPTLPTLVPYFPAEALTCTEGVWDWCSCINNGHEWNGRQCCVPEDTTCTVLDCRDVPEDPAWDWDVKCWNSCRGRGPTFWAGSQCCVASPLPSVTLV